MNQNHSQLSKGIPGVRIEKLIGKGGMGRVYRGSQTYLGRTVAVKIISPESHDSTDPKGDHSELDKRFQREAKLLAGMSQPNIVACYDGGVTEDGCYFLVMEFIDGPDLGRYIHEHGALQEQTSLKLIRDVALALDHALKKDIIHRDVKVENILLQKQNESGDPADFPFVVKLADLGLARYQAQPDANEQITQKGIIFGTPQIMAPEQFTEEWEVNYKIDIYALGCLLYHCVYGRPPFESGSFSAIVAKKIIGELPEMTEREPALHPGTVALIRNMMAYKPGNRPDNYTLIAQTCRHILQKLDSLPSNQAFVKRPNPEPAPRRDGVRDTPVLQPTHTIRQQSGSHIPRPTFFSPLKLSFSIALLVLAGVAIWFFITHNSVPEDSSPLATTETAQPELPLPQLKLSTLATPLFQEDFFHRIDGWVKKGSWGSDEDGPGVIGIAGESLATLIRAHSAKACRFEGSLRFQSAFEAGAGFKLDNGDIMVIRIQNLGESLFCSIANMKKGETNLKQVGKDTLTIVGTPDHVLFSVEQNGGNMVFSVNQEEVGTLTNTHVSTDFFLYNEKGVAIFEEVHFFSPKEKI